MTEPTPEPIEADADGVIHVTPEPDAEVAPDDEQPIDMAAVRKIRREAASLRARMHDLEEQLGAAAARETARDRAEVERIAAEHLIEAQDIWRQQPDMQAYYDDQFAQIVPDKVREATAALIEAKPHLARPQNTPPPTDRPIESLRGGARAPEEPKLVTWSSALRGR